MQRRKTQLEDEWVSIEPRRPGIFHMLTIVGCLAAFGWFYFFVAAVLIDTTNQNLQASDQAHNIKRALHSKKYENLDLSRGQLKGLAYWWPHDTDGVVAPMWSRVAGMLADADHVPSDPGDSSLQDDELFRRGKWFNVRFSFAFLCVLTLGAAWAFPNGTLPVINLMLLSGLGALLPRAVYFHPEPIYYAFFAGTWICCLMALLGNRVVPYIGAGVCAGFAFLTKTAVQPLLLAFLAVMGLRLVAGFLGFARDETRPLNWGKALGGVVLLLAVFVAIVWPRLEFSRREFGDRFHSYPSYWMWMDNFEECYQWMGDHPDRYALQQISSESKPSAMHYWKHHTAGEIVTRAASGWLASVERGLFPPSVHQWGREAVKPWKHLLPSRGLLLVALFGLVCATAAFARVRGERYDAPTQRVISRSGSADRTFAILFVAVLVGGYSFAYGWYEAIGGGERFLLSLYVPLVFTLIWAGQAMSDHLPERGKLRGLHTFAHLLIFAWLLFRMTKLFLHPVFHEAARA
ncbi:MAG: hypothetical protein ACI9R3_003982 [Verrucomicrobiales bacterium]|jgi:hypothetical protein